MSKLFELSLIALKVSPSLWFIYNITYDKNFNIPGFQLSSNRYLNINKDSYTTRYTFYNPIRKEFWYFWNRDYKNNNKLRNYEFMSLEALYEFKNSDLVIIDNYNVDN
jgi:hypothetical protein